jgi:hypothetical protein
MDMAKRLFALALVFSAMAISAGAQVGSGSTVTADVPFSFIVSGKTLPAGTYQIKAIGNQQQITVTSSDKKTSAIALVSTRLAPRSGSASTLVFDVAGAEHYLSEIHVPGADGFQVGGAKGTHTHAIVTGK